MNAPVEPSPSVRPVRRRGTRLAMLARSIQRTMGAFRQHKLTIMVPLFVVLLLTGLVLAFLNTVAPLAPFVYSLI